MTAQKPKQHKPNVAEREVDGFTSSNGYKGRRWPLYPASAAVVASVALLIVSLPGQRTAPTGADISRREVPQVADIGDQKKSLEATTKAKPPDAIAKIDPPPKLAAKGEERKLPVVLSSHPLLAKTAVTTYDLGNGVKLEMINIIAKGRSFLMGSPKDEPDRLNASSIFGDNPEEQHEVTFVRNFAISRYEVTQEQYEAVMGVNPAWFKDPKKPVETVSWDDAHLFIKKLNERLKERKVVFRLPSEAEWEFACRAGTTTAHNTGKSIGKADACFGRSANEGTSPVGSFAPNAIGLYDMHGNVKEWCEDYAGPYQRAPKDGGAQLTRQSTDVRIVRGGDWLFSARMCRSACRGGSAPSNRVVSCGFRLVASRD